MPSAPELHPVQLTDVWVERVSASRRQPRTSDPIEPLLKVSRTTLRGWTAEGPFMCAFRLRLHFPIAEVEAYALDIAVVGSFRGSRPIAETEAHSFARNSALFVLWPYARAYVQQLGVMSGLPVPPLPLVVRPNPPSTNTAILRR
jgi:preprotein translocase subunit SecB